MTMENLPQLSKPVLKYRSMPPYGGEFHLNLPELGMVGRATAFDGLLRSIKEWRKANAWPIGLAFEEEVEREICKQYPLECRETDARVPPSEVRYGVDTVVQGTKVLGRFVAAGRPYESPEEANRRAAQCSGCPFNLDPLKPCGGLCGALKDAVFAIVGNSATQYDGSLRSCSVCKCLNAVAVWVPMAIQSVDYTPEQIEQFKYVDALRGCWKGKWLVEQS